MLLDEDEKKKREEEAKSIINSVNFKDTINTVNYANSNNSKIKTQNDEEQTIINRINEANNIINSVNPRTNIKAPSVNEYDKMQSQENAKKFIDLIDDNKNNTISENNITANISNRVHGSAQDLIKEHLKGRSNISNSNSEVKERVNVIMNGNKLSSLKSDKEKQQEEENLSYKKQMEQRANTIKNPIAKLGKIVQNLWLGAKSSAKEGIYYATDIDALNPNQKAIQLASINANPNLPEIVKREYINQETQNNFLEQKIRKEVDNLNKDGIFFFKDNIDKEPQKSILNKETQNTLNKELDKYRDSFGNIEINSARRNLSNSIEQDQFKIQNNINEISGTFSKKVAELAPSMGNSLVGAGISIVNPYLGTTYFILNAMGSYEYEAKRLGMSNEEARNYGMIMGYMEGATEMVSMDKVIKMSRAASKGMFKETLKNFGLDMLDNAIQEALIDPIDELVKYGISGKAENDYSTVEGGKQLIAQMIQDGFDGALTAMITGGVEVGIGSSLHVYDKIKNGETPTKNEIVDALKDIKNSKKINIIEKFKQSFDYQKQKLLKNDGQLFSYIEQSSNGNINAVNETIGKNIELVNKELAIEPAVVLINGNYNIIDSSSGLMLDSTKYDSFKEAEASFNNRISNIDNATINKINQEVTQAQLNTLQYIEDFNNTMYKLQEDITKMREKDFKDGARDYISSIDRNTKNENKITFNELSTSINQIQDEGKYNIEQTRNILDYVANNIDNVYHQTTPSGTDFLYTKDSEGNITNSIELSKSKYTGSEIKETINNILQDANLSSMRQEQNYNRPNSNQDKKSITFYNNETNYVVPDIQKVTEPFKVKKEYTKKELADIWNNEISEKEYDVKYDNKGNIQSYIAIEKDGKNLVVNQHDSNDNIVKSETILANKGKYTSEVITNAIEKVSSLYDENKPIKRQIDDGNLKQELNNSNSIAPKTENIKSENTVTTNNIQNVENNTSEKNGKNQNYSNATELIKNETKKAEQNFNTNINIEKIDKLSNINFNKIGENDYIKLSKEIFKENINKRIFHNDNTNIDIKVILADIKESAYKAYNSKYQQKFLKEHIEALSRIDEIIKTGLEVSTNNETKNREQYKKWRYFSSQAIIEDKPFLVQFDVTEKDDGYHFRLQRLTELNLKNNKRVTTLALTNKQVGANSR